jgi:hypothetical protein
MSASLTLSVAEFRRAAELCVKHTERTYPEFINGQALRLASFAVRETQKADVNKIAWSLGQTDKRTTNARTGAQLKTARRVYGNTAASLSLYKIVNWRRKRAGKAPLGGQAMSSVARKVRGAALRSTGFIASGWVYSVRHLARVVGYRPLTKEAKISGKPKGYAIPARSVISGKVACEIGNTSLLETSAPRTGSRKGRPTPIGAKGLDRAHWLTAKDMMNHLAQKLAPVIKPFSAA